MGIQPLSIIVDTREQQPLKFSGFENIKLNVDKLDAGDYTLVCHDMPNDDNSIIIERKADAKELIGNLGSGWKRFLREAEILSKYKIRQIVVCGPDNFEFLYSRGYTKLHPNFVYKQLSILLVEYGISTIFFPNRESAENYMFRLFLNVLRKTEREM